MVQTSLVPDLARRSRHRLELALALTIGVGASLAAARTAVAAEPVSGRFHPDPNTDLSQLERLLVETSPDLEQAQLQVELAHTAFRQSRLIPNPRIDLSWATIPVGSLNPPDLARPLANVPNYGIGIAFPINIGKRGPRIRQAKALERGVEHELEALTRARALDLAQTLGDLATASLRVDGFEQVVQDMQRTVEAAQQRVNLSYGVSIDVDRLQTELARARSLVLAARSDVASAQAECALQLGKACDPFENGEAARAYLETWIDAVVEAGSLERRPDLVALTEYAGAARASAKLARAEAIPDPTVRFGYLHDRFVIAGNQLNSLALSLTFDLPVFDHGQVQRDAAIATERRLMAEHSKRITAASAQLLALAEQAELERERRRALRDEAIPIAKQVVASVEKATEQRLLSVAENVQARRVLRELLLEEADAYAAAYAAQIALLRVRAPKEGSHP